MKRMIAMSAVLALALTACGQGDGSAGPDVSPTQTARQRPSSTATLTILEPAQGAVVSAESVPVRLRLKGGTLIDEARVELTPDTGHIHILLDGKTIYVDSDLGLRFDLVEMKNSPKSADPGPLEAGRHLLQFEYVAADHGPFNPRVIQAVTVTVE